MINGLFSLVVLFSCYLLLRFVEWMAGPEWTCNHGRISELREVYVSGNRWEVKQSEESGDVDILPLGEDHSRGPFCACGPIVTIYGARLVVSHNAFDHREIVEEAVDIMNGVENA